MKTIALEEHFWTGEWIEYLRSRKNYPKLIAGQDAEGRRIERLAYSAEAGAELPAALVERLADVGEARLADMDANGIDMQLLCMASGLEPFPVEDADEVSRIINDGLARIVAGNPGRFAGLAALAPQAPERAARELERCVRSLGLKGAKLNSHAGGQSFDDEKFWPIFEAAEALGVPIYLHPRNPPPDQMKAYSGYPALAGSLWGFGADMGLNAMKLACSGVFDRYPGLKIILGHLGEALPFWLWRIENRWTREQAGSRMKKLQKNPAEYIRGNFWVTTSGMFAEAPFLCALSVLGADRILFAVDYPYESNREGAQFLENLSLSGGDKEKISHLNAEKLLGLNPQ